MRAWTRGIIAAAVVLSAVGCGQESPQLSTAPTTSFDTESSSSSGCGAITRSETLTGSAIGGVTPGGKAVATMYRSYCGLSNSLVVSVKSVNYPDGTVLGVTLDWSPIGNITLQGGRGSLTYDMGKFAVSNDEVRVNKGSTMIMIGPYFR